MAEQFAVTQIPGMETGEIPPVPVDRDEKTVIIYSLVDPVWDIDVLPLTYTNSRWSAFFYRADEKHLRRVLPDCLELEDDIVEYWYVDHNNTMLGPYGEMGVTVAASYKGGDGKTLLRRVLPVHVPDAGRCHRRRSRAWFPEEGSLHSRARARWRP